MATFDTMMSSLAASHNLFASDLFKTLAPERAQDNVVFSPASIQSCLALAFLGAEEETAQQLRTGLRLPAELNKASIAEEYAAFLKKNFIATQSASEDAPKLRMANRIYVNDALQLSPQFNQLARTSFESEAVPANLADSAEATASINSWVESQTEGKIKNLLQPDAVDLDTGAILVNAIYFKAKWLLPFSELSTSKAQFRMSGGQTALVPIMYSEEYVKYAELPKLDSKAIELPYKGSDLSMLILLPNKVDGLEELKQALGNVDLNVIAEEMKAGKILIFLPKFRIEFDVDLEEQLQKLGMTEMFGDAADFSCLFAGQQPQKVEKVKHKAFLDVNEAGSEAAAATCKHLAVGVHRTNHFLIGLFWNQKVFRADHPFVFAIRNREAVYFIGHVAKF